MGNADFSKQFLLERKTKLHTLSTFVNFILDLKRILKFIDMKKQNYTFELKTIVTQNTGRSIFFSHNYVARKLTRLHSL